MKKATQRLLSLLCIELCLVWLVPAQQTATRPAAQTAKPAAQSAAPMVTIPGGMFKFSASTTIVLVNLQVKDSKGNPVTNLKPSDVTITENGKPQQIASFEFENIDAGPGLTVAANGAGNVGPSGEELSKVAVKPNAPAAAPTASLASASSQTAEQNQAAFNNRRLMVIYFDLTTMAPEDLGSAIDSATNYVKKQMQPADLVAIASLGTDLNLNQDFTSDKDKLIKVLDSLNPNIAAGYVDGGDGTTDGTADDANSFAVDDSEFNLMNADRSLEGLMSLADMLAPIPQKKTVLVFTSGFTQNGVDNEITERSAINAAVKANVSFYTADPRGLQALPPGGSANTASIRGASATQGGSTLSALGSQFSQQETMSTLATETGGKSFLDTSNFAPVYTSIQQDTRSYYLITYHSTDHAKDGKYRKISVKVDRPDVKLNYRPGYTADADINHLSAEGREAQMQDELTSDTPEEALNIYATDGYFELDPHRYFVPVALAIPGGEIPLKGIHANSTPTVDIYGTATDQAGRQIGHVDSTIKLDEKVIGGSTQQIQTKNLQWTTGFVLAPGQWYELRFAARENQTGQLGAYRTRIYVPDIDAQAAKSPVALRVSSVIAGNQLETARPNPDDPMTESGTEVVPSVTKVFAVNQNLYLYFEVYDPKVTNGATNLKTDVAFYQGKTKAFESQLLTTEQVTDPKRNAAVIQIQIPLSQLKPGYYTCQVNAIDDAAGRFAFPRFTVLVRQAPTAAAATSPGTR